MQKVPVALIRRLCYPSAYRLPHLERLVFPVPKAAVKRPASPLSRLNGPRVLPGSVIDTTALTAGNLPNEEYRFWFGHRQTSWMDSVCRCCGANCYTKTARERHLLEGDCKENLLFVYRRLVKDANCVCCDGRTRKQKWGVPLCSDECIKEWKFSAPGALKFEIMALKEGLKKEAANA